MMRSLKFPKIVNSDEISEDTIAKFIPRMQNQLDAIKNDVLSIIEEVKLSGNKAILKFSEKYDGVKLNEKELKVTEEEINLAYKIIDLELLESFQYAKKNLLKFHYAQKKEDWSIEIEQGVQAGQIYRPIESVGIYIPSGRAIYPSTVLMAATPAYVAGVKDIVICTPPRKDKTIAPEIIVAANEFGIKEIYKIGGVQAIAAMAFGTSIIPKVQKVIGPGNKWVNVAKQILSNIIAIDTPAGPSEILIIADNTAKPDYVISDLVSQIEHDPDNIGILVTNSKDLIETVKKELNLYIKGIQRKAIIRAALENNSLIIKAVNMEDCIRISNLIAPEHLEILIENPNEIIPNINNAGAIFLGPYSPVTLGDYCAGTNHILPTGGNAKKYSGLNYYDFVKIIDILNCTKEGFVTLSKTASKIAEFEKLYAHKKSIEERLKNIN